MRYLNGQDWAKVYALIGVVFVLLSIYHLTIFDPDATLFHWILYTPISFGTSGMILYGAHNHYRNPFPSYRYWRISGWFLLGGLIVTAVGVISLYAGSNTVVPKELLESTQLMLNVGLAIGLYVGTVEAESLEAAEAAVKSETLEKEQERLYLVNELLRHYVLNGLTIIGGFAGRLESSTADPEREWAETIRERASSIKVVIDNIGILTRGEWGKTERTRVDIGDRFREKLESACEKGTDRKIPDSTSTVYANVGVENAIEIITEGLTEAIKEGGTIWVEEDPRQETVSIVAHPIEISEEMENALLEPVASGLGLHLYLAKQILEPAIGLDVETYGENKVKIVFRADFVETENESHGVDEGL